MAIDDNTTYGLTGAQVKDLAQRIQSGGGGGGGTAIDLSQDSYNWNSSTQTTTNPDSIALWLLDPGCYSLSDISVPVYSDYYNTIQQESLIWVFPAQVLTGYIGIMVKNTNSSEIVYRVFDPSMGSPVTVAVFSDVDMTLLSVKSNIIQTDSNAAPTSTDYASRGQVWVYMDTNDAPHLYVSAGTDWSLPTPENTWIELQNSSYSTSEVNTGDTWIDGSPIYKKTIDTGTLPNNASKTVQHGVGVNLKRAIKIEGYAYSPNLGINMSIPDNEIKAQVAGVDIEIYTSADLSMFTESYVTLYYTKTQ